MEAYGADLRQGKRKKSKGKNGEVSIRRCFPFSFTPGAVLDRSDSTQTSFRKSTRSLPHEMGYVKYNFGKMFKKSDCDV